MHLVEALECLGGLLLLLLLDLLFLLELLNESSFLFFSHLGLSFNLSFLLFKLLFDFELFLFDLVRHLLHFFLIFDVGDTTTASTLAVSTHALGLASLAEVNLATRELGKLFSQATDLVTELPDHSVLRIFINTRLVLNVFGARAIS